MNLEKIRPIRSYVLRQGRITKAQQFALENYWERYGIDLERSSLNTFIHDEITSPITLEIGFGNGDSLVTQALNEPENYFIGIEVHTPGVGHCLNIAQQEGLSNLKVICADAVDVLNEYVPEESLHRIQLFFPDPWHKKKHHKRRILQKTFVDTVSSRLIDCGIFHMATDWADYAEHMSDEMKSHEEFTFISDERGQRPKTKFENRGRRLGHDVWDLVYEIRKNSDQF